jgi:curli biogenesis system outer membrane secretion channel CsgG
MSSYALPGALLVLAGALAACKSERPDTKAAPAAEPAAAPAAPAAPARITVTATDFKFDLPAQVPAGAVTLHLINRG